MLLIECLPRKTRHLLTVSGKFDFLYHNQPVALVILGLSGGGQAEGDADQMSHLGYNTGHFAPEFVPQEECSLQDLLEFQ